VKEVPVSLEKLGINEIRVEILVIGSEAAGAKAAIEANIAGGEVLLVTKGQMGRSGSTVMAGRGIQAPLGHNDPRDNPDVFFEDVIKGGAYLNNQKLVEKLTRLAVTEVPKMEKWGAKFVKRGDKFVQYETPGATYARSLTPMGHGGVQWAHALRAELKRQKIKIMEDIFITCLLLSGGQVAGAMGIDLATGSFLVIKAKVTILATGGCPQVYRFTDASRDATGDGMAMAYQAGAELMDMEFQQFFPTACYTPSMEMSQFTAYLRYFLHAKFYNSRGEAFMERYFPLAKEWGLRDATSRAIYLENKSGRGSPHGGAWIAINHLPENIIKMWMEEENPPDLEKLARTGIDLRREALECGPAAHYSMGGVRVNENCETSLPRLYAAGEVAAGMDGAERIDGGPAITWCLTMGLLAGQGAVQKARGLDWLHIDDEQIQIEQNWINQIRQRRAGFKGFEIKNKLKNIMWDYCSLVRDGEGMNRGLDLIREIKHKEIPLVCVPDSADVFNKGLMEALESIHMIELSEMIISTAIRREETRQSHFRTDFTQRDDETWLKNIIIKKTRGQMTFSTAAPIITRMFPGQEGQ
jgi:fumarate reductase (CoM/CoB) subunit A